MGPASSEVYNVNCKQWKGKTSPNDYDYYYYPFNQLWWKIYCGNAKWECSVKSFFGCKYVLWFFSAYFSHYVLWIVWKNRENIFSVAMNLEWTNDNGNQNLAKMRLIFYPYLGLGKFPYRFLDATHFVVILVTFRLFVISHLIILSTLN